MARHGWRAFVLRCARSGHAPTCQLTRNTDGIDESHASRSGDLRSGPPDARLAQRNALDLLSAFTRAFVRRMRGCACRGNIAGHLAHLRPGFLDGFGNRCGRLVSNSDRSAPEVASRPVQGVKFVGPVERATLACPTRTRSTVRG